MLNAICKTQNTKHKRRLQISAICDIWRHSVRLSGSISGKSLTGAGFGLDRDMGHGARVAIVRHSISISQASAVVRRQYVMAILDFRLQTANCTCSSLVRSLEQKTCIKGAESTRFEFGVQVSGTDRPGGENSGLVDRFLGGETFDWPQMRSRSVEKRKSSPVVGSGCARPGQSPS